MLESLRNKNKGIQRDVFYTFLQYQEASKAIKVNINASKFMVDGVGGSVMSLIMAKNRVDAILEAERRYYELDEKDRANFKENIILGFGSKFKNPNGSESMFSKYFNNVIIKPEQIGCLELNKNIPLIYSDTSGKSGNDSLLVNLFQPNQAVTFFENPSKKMLLKKIIESNITKDLTVIAISLIVLAVIMFIAPQNLVF